jgi:hypothetical protein
MGIVSQRTRKIVYRKCDGRCAYCGNDIELAQMQVDHLIPTYWNWDDAECLRNNVVRGTDDPENLMPTCRRCNKWKSSYSLEVFREQIRLQHERLLRDEPGYKLAIDYGMVKPQYTILEGGKRDFVVVFYFEKMNNFSRSHQRITA